MCEYYVHPNLDCSCEDPSRPARARAPPCTPVRVRDSSLCADACTCGCACVQDSVPACAQVCACARLRSHDACSRVPLRVRLSASMLGCVLHLFLLPLPCVPVCFFALVLRICFFSSLLSSSLLSSSILSESLLSCSFRIHDGAGCSSPLLSFVRMEYSI